MNADTINVLFLCTGNSARSIMAEAILNHWGDGRFMAYSAGSFPKDEVHPLTLKYLSGLKLPTESLRSKSWDEFVVPNATQMDFVFTVCDNAANETCPIWPGQPISAHWGTHDPAAAEGDEATRLQSFRSAYIELERRIKLFLNLPHARMDRLKLQEHVRDIGRQ